MILLTDLEKITTNNSCGIDMDIHLRTFDDSKYRLHEIGNDTDPERIFFSSTNSGCEYYTEDQFNENVKMNGILSIIHFNSRSLHGNFLSVKEYLSQFTKTF